MHRSQNSFFAIPVKSFFCLLSSILPKQKTSNESDLGLITAGAIDNILRVSDYFDFNYLSKKLLIDEDVNKIAKILLSSISIVQLDVSSKETSPEEESELFIVLNGH